MAFDKVEKAFYQLRNGGFAVLVEQEQSSSQGNLIAAGDRISPETVNFMVKHARGIIYLALAHDQIERLGLPMMVANSPEGAANTVSIEARDGVSTGISAADRARTIQTASSPSCQPNDLVQPGHVFPLRARPGGVLQRAGMTEGAVDLARLAGCAPAAAMCKILAAHGDIANRAELEAFSAEHGIPLVTASELIQYRLRNESFVREVRARDLVTRWGTFRLRTFESHLDGSSHYAITLGDWSPDDVVLVRVHSECLTGDVFGSIRCDCGFQLERSFEVIAERGRGAIVYLRQEGRGIGLVNKIRAYALQDRGKDTVEANIALGLPPDMRDYGLGCQILFQLNLRKIELLTNNPHKIKGLDGYRIEIVDRVPLEIEPKSENVEYLRTKKNKMGHLLHNV